jgi:hypothetical protein
MALFTVFTILWNKSIGKISKGGSAGFCIINFGRLCQMHSQTQILSEGPCFHAPSKIGYSQFFQTSQISKTHYLLFLFVPFYIMNEAVSALSSRWEILRPKDPLPGFESNSELVSSTPRLRSGLHPKMHRHKTRTVWWPLAIPAMPPLHSASLLDRPWGLLLPGLGCVKSQELRKSQYYLPLAQEARLWGILTGRLLPAASR